jgi:hypothetical protein
MAHIRNVDAHFPVAVGQFAQAECIVQIFGIVRVDGKRNDVAHVATLGDFFVGNFGRNVLRSFFHFRGKFRRQIEFCEDGVDLYLVLTRFSEDAHHVAFRHFACVGPFGHFSDDLLAGLCAIQSFRGDQERPVHLLVVRLQCEVGALLLHFTHVACAAALQHLQHFALGTSAPAADAQQYFVAVQGGAHGVFRHVHIVLSGAEARISRATHDDIDGGFNAAFGLGTGFRVPTEGHVTSASAGLHLSLGDEVVDNGVQAIAVTLAEAEFQQHLLGGDAGATGFAHQGQNGGLRGAGGMLRRGLSCHGVRRWEEKKALFYREGRRLCAIRCWG